MARPTAAARPGPGAEVLQAERAAGQLGMHDGAATLGQVDEPGRAWHVEREPTRVDLHHEPFEQSDLGLERGTGGRALRRSDHPTAPLRVDDHRRVGAAGGVARSSDVDRVQSGDGDGRERGEGER